jgi:Copper transport outer membrane protein, MctB
LIDFRYHIVSLIAVFLALALGLFLGSTTLQSTVTRNLHHQADAVTSRNRSLEANNSLLSAQFKAEQGLTTSVEPYAVSGQLTGGTVALVSAPGVDTKERKAVATTLQLAGATVTADVQLQPAYLDPTQDAELGALATELTLPGRALPQGNGSTEVSSELAAVLFARPGHHAVSRSHVAAALNALSDGKFLSISGNLPTHPAGLAVMLLAAPNAGASATTAQTQDTIVLTLAADLRGSSTGLVIAGPTPVAGDSGGAFAAARADSALTKTVSTVNMDAGKGDDPAAGRIAIVLALAAAATGQNGSYGLGQSTPLPTISASP